jgi:hypothetical protein
VSGVGEPRRSCSPPYTTIIDGEGRVTEHTGRLAGAHWPLGQEHSRDWIRLLALVAKHAAKLARTAGELLAWARPTLPRRDRTSSRPGQPIYVPRHTCSCSQHTPKP